MNNEDKADEGTFSYRTLANAFQKQVVSRAKGNKGFKPGAFGPTYGQDQLDRSEEGSGDASNQEMGHSKSRKAGQKRPHKPTTSKGSQEEKCLGYGLGHKLPDCFYLFPKKAFEGFKPREHIQKRVE